MTDGNVSVSKLIAVLLWAIVAMLVGFAWLGYYMGLGQLSNLLGFTACATSALAAVFQIKCYAVRAVTLICALDRADRQGRGLRPL